MRVVTAPTSPINMETTGAPHYRMTGAYPECIYQHQVRWDPQPGCQQGFLAQKVERDMKFSFGEVTASDRWKWDDETTVRASYWEVWEVVDAADGNGQPAQMRVYPAVQSGHNPPQFATSWGEMSDPVLRRDQHQMPKSPPDNYPYRGHDLFSESRPKDKDVQGKTLVNRGLQGRFKIKGSVYFLPNRDTGAVHPWVTTFFRAAARGKKFGVFRGSCYTGGALWQQDGGLSAPPGSTLVITRYEAGEFYDVRNIHFNSSCTNPPPPGQYCRTRAYPHQVDNVVVPAVVPPVVAMAPAAQVPAGAGNP